MKIEGMAEGGPSGRHVRRDKKQERPREEEAEIDGDETRCRRHWTTERANRKVEMENAETSGREEENAKLRD